MQVNFTLHYAAQPSEYPILVVSEPATEEKIPLTPSAEGRWTATLQTESPTLRWHYEIAADGPSSLRKEYRHRRLHLPTDRTEIFVEDYWTELAQPTLLAQSKVNLQAAKKTVTGEPLKIPPGDAVVLRLHLPQLLPGMQIEVLGDDPQLGLWQPSHGRMMTQTDDHIWQVSFTPGQPFTAYKYALHFPAADEAVLWEEGPDRRLSFADLSEGDLHCLHDFAFRWPADALPKMAGVAVPVFSLRSGQSLGIGEFPDLKLLGTWAEKAGLRLIQVLPVNDTTAQYNWWDSYPYAAISVHALNPMYISPRALCYALSAEEQEIFHQNQKVLEAAPVVNFPQVQQVKWSLFRRFFTRKYDAICQNAGFGQFLKENSTWLMPYAAFCHLRDAHGTPDFHLWKTHRQFSLQEISVFFQPNHPAYPEVLFHAWLQYEAHRQLKDAVTELHRRGIALKGDLPIGIYRHSVEAWAEPEYFNLNFQAGAPPDFYSQEGQNWGFPTYRWETMAADGYRWWQNRLHSLEKYFDALRIDHILGFFRIWSIPLSATSAALGYFRPSRPYSEKELRAAGFSAEFVQEMSVPQFSQNYLEKIFAKEAPEVLQQFFESGKEEKFVFKPEFSCQRLCAEYFNQNPKNYAEALLHLHTEVLFIEEKNETGTGHHPRVEGSTTDRFVALDPEMQEKYHQLSEDYFHCRHEAMWKEAALEKLSALLPHTRMLVCAEDLGFQPTTVREVMQEQGLLGLKVLQIPEGSEPYLEPGSVDYFNVITTSTHDSESLRGWWENHLSERTALFRELLHQRGTPPKNLPPILAEKTNRAFLDAPAMLAILPLQDWLAMEAELQILPPEEERINHPAIIPNHWQYRMPLSLEDLNRQETLCLKIRQMVGQTKRGDVFILLCQNYFSLRI